MDTSAVDVRRRASRARRVRWAATFAAFGLAAAFASAQAAAHERSAVQTQAAVECTAGIKLDYEVTYTASIGSFALAGMKVRHFDETCAGRDVVVVLHDAEGRPLASGELTVTDGATVRFDAEGPVDARDVEAVEVLAHL